MVGRERGASAPAATPGTTVPGAALAHGHDGRASTPGGDHARRRGLGTTVRLLRPPLAAAPVEATRTGHGTPRVWDRRVVRGPLVVVPGALATGPPASQPQARTDHPHGMAPSLRPRASPRPPPPHHRSCRGRPGHPVGLGRDAGARAGRARGGGVASRPWPHVGHAAGPLLPGLPWGLLATQRGVHTAEATPGMRARGSWRARGGASPMVCGFSPGLLVRRPNAE